MNTRVEFPVSWSICKRGPDDRSPEEEAGTQIVLRMLAKGW